MSSISHGKILCVFGIRQSLCVICMCSGPTLFLILSGEGAVSRVRDIIGPVDPAVAKDTAPERYAFIEKRFRHSFLVNEKSDLQFLVFKLNNKI
jgi:nucleoside diphosphate kinase